MGPVGADSQSWGGGEGRGGTHITVARLMPLEIFERNSQKLLESCLIFGVCEFIFTPKRYTCMYRCIVPENIHTLPQFEHWKFI